MDAELVLYGTNTFAFHNPESLAIFLGARSEVQRRYITALALLPAQVDIWNKTYDTAKDNLKFLSLPLSSGCRIQALTGV